MKYKHYPGCCTENVFLGVKNALSRGQQELMRVHSMSSFELRLEGEMLIKYGN